MDTIKLLYKLLYFKFFDVILYCYCFKLVFWDERLIIFIDKAHDINFIINIIENVFHKYQYKYWFLSYGTYLSKM